MGSPSRIPGARTMRVSGSDYWDPPLPQHRSRGRALRRRGTDAGGPGEHARDDALHRHRRLDRAGSALGDSGWRNLLAAHHAVVRRELARFRGEDGTPQATASHDVRRPGARDPGRPGDRRRRAELGLDIRAVIQSGSASYTKASRPGSPSRRARAATEAPAREVIVTSTVKDLVAGTARLRGSRRAQLKEVRIMAAVRGDRSEPLPHNRQREGEGRARLDSRAHVEQAGVRLGDQPGDEEAEPRPRFESPARPPGRTSRRCAPGGRAGCPASRPAPRSARRRSPGAAETRTSLPSGEYLTALSIRFPEHLTEPGAVARISREPPRTEATTGTSCCASAAASTASSTSRPGSTSSKL